MAETVVCGEGSASEGYTRISVAWLYSDGVSLAGWDEHSKHGSSVCVEWIVGNHRGSDGRRQQGRQGVARTARSKFSFGGISGTDGRKGEQVGSVSGSMKSNQGTCFGEKKKRKIGAGVPMARCHRCTGFLNFEFNDKRCGKD